MAEAEASVSRPARHYAESPCRWPRLRGRANLL